jgi:hypothetical protein
VQPLGGNAIFTLAASFIVECPASNAPLPFTAFPGLSVDASTCSDQQPGKGYYMSRRTNPADMSNDSPKPKEENKIEIKVEETIEIKDGNKNDNNGGKGGNDQTIICAAPRAGQGAKFQSAMEIPQGSFLTFVSGLTVISVQATISGSSIEASVPESISGQSYVFVTKSAMSGTIMDSEVISGPAILEGESIPVRSLQPSDFL